ncbi:hypothetical protein PCE1_004583 [Barthelona sp. PCE]
MFAFSSIVSLFLGLLTLSVVIKQMTSLSMPRAITLFKTNKPRVGRLIRLSSPFEGLKRFIGLLLIRLSRRDCGVVTDMMIEETKTRFYYPNDYEVLNEDNKYKAIIFIHGGGWVSGSVPRKDLFCRMLSHDTESIVIQIYYKKAPEHPFPTGLMDCFVVAKNIIEHGEVYGIDPTNVVISGDSAGGNLALFTAMMLRDAGLKAKGLNLIYPALLTDFSGTSYNVPEYSKYSCNKAMMMLVWSLYAPPVCDIDLEKVIKEEKLDTKEMLETAYHKGSVITCMMQYFALNENTSYVDLPPVAAFISTNDVLMDDSAYLKEQLLEANIEYTEAFTEQLHGYMSCVNTWFSLDKVVIAENDRITKQIMELQK